ncbi:cytochrome P450 [Stipitochalara longipes BDJ]|nr:cytochrome P450 [Stipitochalara longipes BDJ]
MFLWVQLLSALVFALGLKRIIAHLLDSLRVVPGPFLARFTRLWYLVDSFNGRGHETISRLHHKYGPVVRLSPVDYSIADLDVYKQIYGPRTAYEKSDWYQAFRSPEKEYTIFTDQNNKHYSQIRRKYANAFSLSNVTQYEESLNKYLGIFCKKLTQIANEKSQCDLNQWCRFFAFDTICQMAIGDLGVMEHGSDHQGIISMAHTSTVYGNVIGRIPEWHSWIWKILPTSKSEKGAIVWIQEAMRKKIQGDFSSTTATFTDVWLQQEEKMSQDDIFLGLAASVGGGTDTSSVGIVNIIYLLWKHPEICEKLQAEIEDAVEREGLKSGLISYETARRLPYLQAVIKESMRLVPIISVQPPRCVPKGGDTLCGYFFREGLNIGVNPWSTRMNVKYFGDDADTFRPERWLGEGEEVKRNEYYHMPFSIGPRSCIGRHIAIFEITKSIAQLVYLFSFHIALPKGELRYHSYSSVQPDKLLCRLELRKSACF